MLTKLLQHSSALTKRKRTDGARGKKSLIEFFLTGTLMSLLGLPAIHLIVVKTFLTKLQIGIS